MPKKAPAKAAVSEVAATAPVKATPAKAAAKGKGKAAPKVKAASTFDITLYDETAIKEEEGRNGINVGVSTGLRFTHYVNQLLFNNYDAQMSDEELELAISTEFPNRESFQDMGRYRACFNSGSAGFGVPDETGEAQKLPKENRLPKYGVDVPAAAE